MNRDFLLRALMKKQFSARKVVLFLCCRNNNGADYSVFEAMADAGGDPHSGDKLLVHN